MFKQTTALSQSMVLALGLMIGAAGIVAAPIAAEAQAAEKKAKKKNDGLTKAQRQAKRAANKAKKAKNLAAKKATKKTKKVAVKKVKRKSKPTVTRKTVTITRKVVKRSSKKPRRASWEHIYGTYLKNRNGTNYNNSTYIKKYVPSRYNNALKKRSVKKRIKNGRLGSFESIRNGDHKFVKKAKKHRKVSHGTKRKINRIIDKWF